MTHLLRPSRLLTNGLASVVLLGAGSAQADLPELFYDDFDDGDYDGWVVDSPMFDTLGPPDVVASPEGYAISGVGQGYGQDDGLGIYLGHPLDLTNVAEVAIEMRAITGPDWPNSASTMLYSGPISYYRGMDYGESNQRADFLIMEDGSDDWVHSHPMGSDVFNWHTYRWERDTAGWWSFYLDGALIEADYYQHNTFTDFDWVELHPLRNQSAIEWVRLRGNIIPTPGSFSLFGLTVLAATRRRCAREASNRELLRGPTVSSVR